MSEPYRAFVFDRTRRSPSLIDEETGASMKPVGRWRAELPNWMDSDPDTRSHAGAQGSLASRFRLGPAPARHCRNQPQRKIQRGGDRVPVRKYDEVSEAKHANPATTPSDRRDQQDWCRKWTSRCFTNTRPVQFRGRGLDYAERFNPSPRSPAGLDRGMTTSRTVPADYGHTGRSSSA